MSVFRNHKLGSNRQKLETRLQSSREHFKQIDQELNVHLGINKTALTLIIRLNRTMKDQDYLGEDSVVQRLRLEDDFNKSWMKKCRDLTRTWIEAEQALHDAKDGLRR